MRSSLNVILGFGLASIPVGLAKMIDDDDSVEFRTLHATCSTPVQEVKRCPACAVDVPAEDQLKGFEVGKHDFVLFTPEEVAAAKPLSDGVVRLDKFVPVDDLPQPHLWLRHYVVIPDRVVSDRYGALLDALVASETAGVGQSVLWRKRRSCVLRAAPDGSVLLLSTVNQSLPKPVDFEPPPYDDVTFALTVDLVQRMSGQLKPSDLAVPDPVRMLVETRMGVKAKRPAELKVSPVGDYQAQLRASMKKTKVKR